MKIYKNHIHIGIDNPFSILHASDTHLTFADERDCERKLELAKNRGKAFPEAENNLKFIENKAVSENKTLIYTGDLIDFVSVKNLEEAKRFTDSVDCFMAAGNHEFSLFLGEAKEDANYRNQSLAKVQASFKNDIRCSSRVINGVLFIAIDNSYYLFEEEQLNFLKRECSRGLPVVLCMHTPLYTMELYESEVQKVGDPAYLMAVPEELMKNYSSHRYEQQLADEVTERAYEYIIGCKAIKAILAGHLHNDYISIINNSLIQLVSGVSSLREVYFD